MNLIPALLLVCGGFLTAAEMPPGFGPEMTAAERRLAAEPQPDAWFREMTGGWHGVPGLPALRERWLGFAGAETGAGTGEGAGAGLKRSFAVLAALIFEAEGKPEEALAEMRTLPGPDARWNEGRLLALMGDEAGAVRVFSALLTAPSVPGAAPAAAGAGGAVPGAESGAAETSDARTAADALLALTELDCLRGDFKSALARSTAAWEARGDGAFRLRILERHLSLLAGAGEERGFLEKVVTRSAPGAAGGSERAEALQVMAAMSLWFTADPRLREARKALAPRLRVGPRPWMQGIPDTPPGIWPVTLEPTREELERRAMAGEITPETAVPATALLIKKTGGAPDAERFPAAFQAWREQPMAVASEWFREPDPSRPLPDFILRAAEALEPGAPRLVLELMSRAWRGGAGPKDVETLSRVIAEAPRMRGKPGPYPPRAGEYDEEAWPLMDSFPAERVVWNLRGRAWLDFYKLSCRLAPLRPRFQVNGSADVMPLLSWAEWRPHAPGEGAENLTAWAWRQLLAAGAGTAERAAALAGGMGNPADQAVFAVVCGRPELLRKWCQKAEWTRRLPTGLIHMTAQALEQSHHGPGALPVSGGEAAGVGLLREEMARRLGLDPADLARMAPAFQSGQTPEQARRMRSRPVDGALAAVWSGPVSDVAWKKARQAVRPGTVPHPLAGMPFCPSVDRFAGLAAILTEPRAEPAQFVPEGMRRQDRLLRLLLGGGMGRGILPCPPALLRDLAAFPTANPVKQQVLRWAELTGADPSRGGETPDASARPEEERRRAFHKEEEDRRRRDPARPPVELRALAAAGAPSLAWDLVAAGLEEDPVRRQAALRALAVRSPLAEGIAGTADGRQAAAAPAAGAEADSKADVKAVVTIFREMLADSGTRAVLEVPGMMSRLLQDFYHSRIAAALRRLTPESALQAAAALMDLKDPLAARLAVVVVRRIEGDFSRNFDPGPEWIQKGLAAHPDDPELLMSRADREDSGARLFFLRALAVMPSLDAHLGNQGIEWCGSNRNSQWPEAEEVEAIVRFAARTDTRTLPVAWVSSLLGIFENPAELEKVRDLRALVRALTRFRPLWDRNAGRVLWMPVLRNLQAAGHADLAAEAAGTLLADLRGPLWNAPQAEYFRQPWSADGGAEITDRTAEGWRVLMLAGSRGADREGLADRLEKNAAGAPGDEQAALTALLARALTRPLTVADTALTAVPDPAARHRILACASWFLTAEQLPAALCLEAWEAECGVIWTVEAENHSRAFLCGMEYLEKLRRAGAEAAVRGLLPLMSSRLMEEVRINGPGIFYGDRQTGAARLILETGSEVMRAEFKAALGEPPPGGLPEGSRRAGILANVVALFPDADSLPGDLAERVEEILRVASAPEEAGFEPDPDLTALLRAVVIHPRWRPVAGRLAERGRNGDSLALQSLLAVLGSGREAPRADFRFEPGKAGEGLLRWEFQGLQLPGKPGLSPPVTPGWWRVFSDRMGGMFDAAVILESLTDGSRTVAARIESMGTAGSVPLTGLPPAGRLMLRLTGRGAPGVTVDTPATGFHSLPPLCSGSADGPEFSAPHGPDARPPGWRVVCGPAPAGESRAWHIQCETGAPPPQLSLLLLDESGRVCAGVPVERAGLYAGMPDFEGFTGTVVRADSLTPEAGFPEGASAAQRRRMEQPRIRVTGPPRFLVLAVPTAPAGGGPESGSSQAERLLENAGRITVRNWPVPPPGARSGRRLEIVRQWWLPERVEEPVAYGGTPLRAAWCSGSGLHLLDLETPGEPVMRVVELPVEISRRGRSLSWHGEVVSVLFQPVPEEGKPDPGSALVLVKTDARTPGTEVHRLARPVEVLTREWRFPPPEGVRVLGSRGEGAGVITREGRFLPWPEEKGEPPPPITEIFQISPTRLAWREPAADHYQEGTRPVVRRTAVLDWTDGILTRGILDGLPREMPRAAARPDEEFLNPGISLAPEHLIPPAGPMPLRLQTLTYAGKNRFIGFRQEDGGACLVLLRRGNPAPGP